MERAVQLDDCMEWGVRLDDCMEWGVRLYDCMEWSVRLYDCNRFIEAVTKLAFKKNSDWYFILSKNTQYSISSSYKSHL